MKHFYFNYLIKMFIFLITARGNLKDNLIQFFLSQAQHRRIGEIEFLTTAIAFMHNQKIMISMD